MTALRILVVDDDVDVRETIAEALADEGFEVVVAENGLAALERLRGGVRPDVILLDIMMPVMDGWEFRAAQRAEPAIASIPVVIFTASGVSKETADELGAQGHLRKPLRFEELLRTVNRFAGPERPDDAAG